MHALTRFLFPAPARRSVGSIVAWWEKRRLAYNAIVGTAGLVSIAGMTTLMTLMPNGGWPGLVPWQPIVAFGLAANVFYFLGPAVEVALTKIWGDEVLPTGPALFRMGLTFSVGLALFPLLVTMIVWVAQVLRAVAGIGF